MPQLELTFTDFLNATIAPQNNRESEALMQSECERYANQSMRLLAYLQQGGRINSSNAYQRLRITDLRPRIATLLRMGYKLTYEVLPGKLREWRMGE